MVYLIIGYILGVVTAILGVLILGKPNITPQEVINGQLDVLTDNRDMVNYGLTQFIEPITLDEINKNTKKLSDLL